MYTGNRVTDKFPEKIMQCLQGWFITGYNRITIGNQHDIMLRP